MSLALSQPEIERWLALFILALEALSKKANHVTNDNPAILSGLDYFCAANDILDLDKDSRYTLFEAQYYILKACVSPYT